jgi:uncharacterized membrane protein YecN with MAPEG domain
MPVAVVCTSLLGLLLFGLGLFVSIQRQRFRTIIGHDPDPEDPTHRAVRAHANTAEYAPFLAILFLWHGAHAASSWVLWAIAVATASRYLLAGSLLFGPTMAKPNPGRFVGALATYVCGLLLAAAMLVQAFGSAG